VENRKKPEMGKRGEVGIGAMEYGITACGKTFDRVEEPI